MNIGIFKDITTENALRQLEEDGLKYQGLYVDMDNLEERKYVKDNAALISGLLKKLDRARIDKSREYKNSVEAEASDIKSRLEEANKPFTLLLDEHKAKRAKILADQKAIEDALALRVHIEQDHEQAIMEDKVAMFEKAERKREKEEYEAQLVKEAVESAQNQAELDRLADFDRERKRLQDAADKVKADAERRYQDVEHKKAINNTALRAIVEQAGLTRLEAMDVIKAIAKGVIPGITINY